MEVVNPGIDDVVDQPRLVDRVLVGEGGDQALKVLWSIVLHTAQRLTMAWGIFFSWTGSMRGLLGAFCRGAGEWN
ncbi:hypothetical protein AUQ48_16560 [Kocuria flava]|uniref:Uncharacterized protein n=1 Tax=Kocuria flava TaxID=446860 RepID=A0A2N4SY87_9MICC|nr:hypothetical protein AUQ48_16560 [Kocuria flava]